LRAAYLFRLVLCGLVGIAICNAAIATEYVSRKGFVTLQFDDGHLIQHTHIAPLLESHGFRGSFGIITRTSDMGIEHDAWRMLDLYQRGHEIQDHTTCHDYRWATHVDTVDDGQYEWIEYTFVDTATWAQLFAESKGILDSLGIEVVGWNQPGGSGGTGTIPDHPTWEWRGFENDSPYELVGARFGYALGFGVLPWTAHVNLRGHNYPDRYPFFNVTHWTIDYRSLAEIKTGIADAVAAGLWYLAVSHISNEDDLAKIESLVEWLDANDVEVLKCCEGWQRICFGTPNPFENQLPQCRMLTDIDCNGKPDGYAGACEWDTVTPPPRDSCYCLRVFGDTEFYCYGPELGDNAFSIWMKSTSSQGKVYVIYAKIGFDWEYLGDTWTTLWVDTTWSLFDTTAHSNLLVPVEDEVDRIKFVIRPVDVDTVIVCSPKLMWVPDPAGTRKQDAETFDASLKLVTNPVRAGLPLIIHTERHAVLYDALGRLVARSGGSHQSPKMVPTDGLSPGVYFLRIDDPRIMPTKIIILR